MSSLNIATTEKNKPSIMFNGFNYTIDRNTDKKTYWKCEYCRTIKCKGRIHTDLNHTIILLENDDHNHPASAVNNEVRSFQNKLRCRAITTTKSTQHVVDHCLNNASDQMAARFPNFKYIKRNIHRQRQKNDLQQIPHDKNFTVVPTPSTMTIRDDRSMQFDSGSGGHL